MKNDPEKELYPLDDKDIDQYLLELAQEDLHIINELRMESVIDTLSSY